MGVMGVMGIFLENLGRILSSDSLNMLEYDLNMIEFQNASCCNSFFLKWSCLCCCLSFAQEKVEHLSSAFVISLVLEIFHKRLASKAGLKRS